jgi:DNA-binding Xre family transcriptional regulator
MKVEALEKIESAKCKVRLLTLEKICRHLNISSKELLEDIMTLEELTAKGKKK